MPNKTSIFSKPFRRIEGTRSQYFITSTKLKLQIFSTVSVMMEDFDFCFMVASKMYRHARLRKGNLTSLIDNYNACWHYFASDDICQSAISFCFIKDYSNSYTTQHTAFMRVFANVKVHITKGEFTKLILSLQSESVIF